MPLNLDSARERLKTFDFRHLLIEELGWDRHHARPVVVELNKTKYTLNALAEKRGMVVFECEPGPDGHVPDYPARRKIEREAAKVAHEHLIVFIDAAKTTQIWQWVRREPGRPLACREHVFHKSQSGEALLQKLQAIAFDLDEEDGLTIAHVGARARKAFDLDRVTKRFYDRFQKEHAAFLAFIQGIPVKADREWYASLMLNRLMFIYFIQKKGFLDGNEDYLRNRLAMMRQRKGKDRFLSFYRHFLLRLFHDGLGNQARDAELDALLGKVPFLNGGLFDVHALEQNNKDIQIPDEAFEKLFDFFDAYRWHLDERPLRADNEINPDVLGYIFEKYINQKQMGAYYTKEDITEYISKNTIVPWLFDAAEKDCAIAFRPEGALWGLLRADPDRYIYAPVRRGVVDDHGQPVPESALPDFVQAGMRDPKARMFDKRYNLAQAEAEDPIRLPTETWREYAARRERCLDLRAKLRAGEIHAVNDLVTWNLDVRQFAQDAIANCEGPELLRAFYRAIERISILDPTCGSGAFLFAALGVLEPLYEACLQRMRGFLEDLGRSPAKHPAKKFDDFCAILARVATHPNERHFILKSIVIGNLYGVDIMEEAVEICKLRLFLKLVAQVDKIERVEPLPDIDFNIRSGNTLIGYATEKQARDALSAMDGGDWIKEQEDWPVIEQAARVVRDLYAEFRRCQTDPKSKPKDQHKWKKMLGEELQGLRDKLNVTLAKDYGIDDPTGKSKKFAAWRESHQPFHWFVEFYGIMHDGGFDVIIGNPPWKEYSAVKKTYAIHGYETESCGNLYALCTERAVQLIRQTGYFSFIVQLPLVSSSRMVSLRNFLMAHSDSCWIIPCDDRPGKLFEGLQHCRSTLFLLRKGSTKTSVLYATRYNRWASEVRGLLFPNFQFSSLRRPILQGQFPKIGSPIHSDILIKMLAPENMKAGLSILKQESEDFIFYQEATQYWVKATVGLPYYAKNGSQDAPAHGRYLFLHNEQASYVLCSLLHSSLFYGYFIGYTDCFHLSDSIVESFPIPASVWTDGKLATMGQKLMKDLNDNAIRKTISTKIGESISYAEFYVSKSKPILDKIDHVLAAHYGFTDEELDFIVNYDIKYRMGNDLEDES
jgi:hypothetical protein